MADNSTAPPITLPASLDLPAHLSAQKYFFVCTLTVAAWDTLVLSPRTWRLMKTSEWPLLKILFFFLRVFMPVEFTVVGVAFFDTKWSLHRCSQFFLFEPICTAIMLAVCSVVHVIRVHAIYEKKRPILNLMGGLLAVQIVVTAICCGFYTYARLKETQGCIATPKHTWVGIYWLSATLLYTASFALALKRSFASLKIKPVTYWKLMLRDGLNLYGAVWLVNLVNMIFWFVMPPKPDNLSDPVKTIVTSMAAVLTASMTMRIILSVRGSLVHGGSFAVGSTAHTSRSGGTTHVISTNRAAPGVTSNPVLSINQAPPATYNVPLAEGKEGDWAGEYDNKSSVADGKEGIGGLYAIEAQPEEEQDNVGVKITIDTETDYGRGFRGEK